MGVWIESRKRQIGAADMGGGRKMFGGIQILGNFGDSLKSPSYPCGLEERRQQVWIHRQPHPRKTLYFNPLRSTCL